MLERVLKFLLLMLVAFIVLFVAFGAGFGLNYFLVQAQPPTQVPKNFALMSESWNIIKGEFYSPIPDPKALMHGAIRGMLGSLGDPNTVLIEPEPAKNEKANLQGNTGDIGLTLDLRNGVLTVISPIPGSPADKAGLRSGDVLLKIDDRDLMLKPATLQEANNLLRGPIGSKLTLNYHRIGESKAITVDVTREQYALPTVESKMIPNTTYGYIKITMETAETANEFAKALDSVKNQKATGIVLDLRNNPGGLFPDPVLDISGQFLKNSDTVVVEKYRDGTEKEYKAGSKRGATDVPLVVLVNSGTASAAEIIAGALKDYKRAPLIGEPTYGKGSVQVIRTLSDGSALHITIATWLTPKKTQIEGTGLAPDIAVPLTDQDIQKSADPQLDRAIQYLQKGA